LAITQTCECGNSLSIAEEHAGKRAKCPACGRALTVASHIEPKRASQAQYVYKMVQIPPSIEVGQGVSVGQKAASYLERVVNVQAREGWDFYRIDSIGITVPPGCLGAFLGAHAANLEYYVVTFRRRPNSLDAPIPDPAEEARKARDLSAQLAKEKQEAANQQAELLRSQDAEMKSARRAEKEAAYRAKGIEPGPFAWFRALHDVTQSVLLGLAIAILALAILIFVLWMLVR
jgi:hypothetical protein